VDSGDGKMQTRMTNRLSTVGALISQLPPLILQTGDRPRRLTTDWRSSTDLLSRDTVSRSDTSTASRSIAGRARHSSGQNAFQGEATYPTRRGATPVVTIRRSAEIRHFLHGKSKKDEPQELHAVRSVPPSCFRNAGRETAARLGRNAALTVSRWP